MSDLLLSFYGDDLTGSTDVMEALASRGVPTILFVGIPTDSQLRRFPTARAVGLAGTSRSETTAWMDEHLPRAFDWLAELGAPSCHYKVCSTFDSSPTVGSIGRALDLGQARFGGVVPVVVGAPQLRRWTVFGQLFAAYQGQVYRIDRHPVMSRHPVTPMTEADLVRHLSQQTKARIGHVDQLSLALADADADACVDAAAAASDALLLDVADPTGQAVVGRQLLRLQAAGSRFVVGSSGVEYALAAAWAARSAIEPPAAFAPPGARDRIAIVSGSVSPTTARQIGRAEQDGFSRIAVAPSAFFRPSGEAVAAAARQADEALAAGRSVILHTALGPDSDLGADLDGHDGARHAIGRGLGQLLAAVVREAGLERAVIAGGDTSSHALREMGIFALTTCLPLPRTPGSPLCTAHSDDPVFDGLQIALKGGQIGDDDYFLRIRDGKA